MAFRASTAAPSPQRDAMTARNSARVFYWIGAFSLINCVMALLGSTVALIFSLDSPLAAVAIGLALSNRGWGTPAVVVAFVIAAVIILAFMSLGMLAERGKLWAFGVGLVFVVGDAALSALIGDWLAVGIHVLLAVLFVTGLLAGSRLKKAGLPFLPPAFGKAKQAVGPAVVMPVGVDALRSAPRPVTPQGGTPQEDTFASEFASDQAAAAGAPTVPSVPVPPAPPAPVSWPPQPDAQQGFADATAPPPLD